MNEHFSKLSKTDQDLKWARIWFHKFSKFHQRTRDLKTWDFTCDEVIDFLRFKRDNKTPGWQRMNVLNGIIFYRKHIQRRDVGYLFPIRDQMKKNITIERAREQGYASIREVEGIIDPKEIDAAQEFRRSLRRHGLKLRTERAYVSKLKAFMHARGLQNLADFEKISSKDVEAHLTDLAVDGNVAPSTQNVAFHALLKFFELVLEREMGKIEAIRAKKHKYIPTILSTNEVSSVFDGLQDQHLVIAKLLYGCGLRISEALRLRIKDLDFENCLIEIRESKGDKSRFVPMPKHLDETLKRYRKLRKLFHEQDLDQNIASVWLPHALNVKYPNAHREFRWQYLFASHRLSRDPRTGKSHRHHLHNGTFPRHLRRAVDAAQIDKHVTTHTFRHCFATHLLQEGTDIRTIQQLLGHKDVATTMIYTHVIECDKITSPLDRLQLLNEQPIDECKPDDRLKEDRSAYSIGRRRSDSASHCRENQPEHFQPVLWPSAIAMTTPNNAVLLESNC